MKKIKLFRILPILFIGFIGATSFAADTTPPTVTITSKPSSYTKATSVSFSFSATDASGIKSIQCKLDSAAYASCTSPKSYSTISVGSHTFYVRATDKVNNVRTVSASFKVDRTAPALAFTSKPPSSSTSTAATFAFSVSDASPILTIRCGMDTSTLTACASPKSYSGLSVGTHVMKVQAKDSASNISTISYSFAVDARAPASTAFITELRLANNNLGGVVIMPMLEGSTINLSTLPTTNVNVEALASSTNGISKITFVLDNYANTELNPPYAMCGDWTACPLPSPLTTVGSHTLTVTPFDGSGVQGTAKVVHFSTVQGTTPPPPPPPATNFANLAWDANTESDLAGYKVYYGKTPGAYTSSLNVGLLSSPAYTISNLDKGVRYFFAVKAYNSSGLESSFSSEVFKDIPLQ